MENKNATAQLLSEMHQNVTSGAQSLSAITPYVKDKFLMSNITSQLEGYSAFADTTSTLLKKHGVPEKKTSLIKKAATAAGVMLSAALDPSDRHMAQMIEKNTRNNLRQLEDRLGELSRMGADNDAVALCRKIVDFEVTESGKIKDHT